MQNNFEVALTKRLCPVCCKEQDGEIIRNFNLTEKDAKQVKEMHNQVVGYGELCDDCKETIKDGIYLIGVLDEEQSNNPNRSGHIVGITNEAFQRIFDMPGFDKQFCFLHIDLMRQIGLISENV